jgi:heme exporter protein D
MNIWELFLSFDSDTRAVWIAVAVIFIVDILMLRLAWKLRKKLRADIAESRRREREAWARSSTTPQQD